MRRKADADCVVAEKFKDPVGVEENCACSDEDYEWYVACAFIAIATKELTRFESQIAITILLRMAMTVFLLDPSRFQAGSASKTVTSSRDRPGSD